MTVSVPVLFFAQNQLFVFLPALGIERQSVQPGILLRGHTLRAVKLQLFAASEERAAADLRHAGGNFHTLERRALGKAARPQLRHARLNAHPLHLAALGEGQRAHALHAAGMTSVRRWAQPENAISPICLRLSGRMTRRRAAHPSNARGAMATTGQAPASN